MAEFTGERVIPGEVDPNLWNEHFARYAYAAQFASPGMRVADLGCGTGYGTAELARHAAVTVGLDVSVDAVQYARARYPEIPFLAASVERIPLASGRFDLITAFEVIEHLDGWPALLAEARRLLSPNGLFLVSTPNKSYYAESRRQDGPNPFHVHEFEYQEFADAMSAAFPHSAILLENHTAGVAITGVASSTTGWQVETTAPDAEQIAQSHFYLAVGSLAPLPPLSSFLLLPQSANLLAEREHHIDKLAGEVAKKDRWIADYTRERDEMIAKHHHLIAVFDRQQSEMAEQAAWTEGVKRDLAQTQNRVAQLQDELATQQAAAEKAVRGYEGKLADLEAEHERTQTWARDLDARLTAELSAVHDAFRQKSTEFDEKCRHLSQIMGDLADTRFAWEEAVQRGDAEHTRADQLAAELQQVQTLLAFVRDSRWVKLGRTIHVGPAL